MIATRRTIDLLSKFNFSAGLPEKALQNGPADAAQRAWGHEWDLPQNKSRNYFGRSSAQPHAQEPSSSAKARGTVASL
jgi:hypothetical protein